MPIPYVFDNFEGIDAYADIGFRTPYEYATHHNLIYNTMRHTNQIQIFYNLHGTQFITVGDKTLKTVSGDIIIIPDWTYIRISDIKDDEKHNIIQYDPGIFMRSPFLEPCLTTAVTNMRKFSSTVLHPPKQTDKKLRALFEKYNGHSGFGFETMRFSTILKIIETIEKFTATLPEPDYNPPKAFEAVDFINRHFDEDIQLKDIADSMGISERHLGVIFKQLTDITPKQYIDLLRINIAKLIIKSHESNINDAFYATGYSTRSSFFRTFKKFIHQTPDEYKRFYNNNPLRFYNQKFLSKVNDDIPDDYR